MFSIYKIIFSITIGLLVSTTAYSASETIEMLNKSGNEMMVYSKKVVKINVGDSVLWKASTKGHNVEFIKNGVPEGVDKFKSKMNVDVEYTFTVPGIYAYWCTPHKAMGMIGLVVVGDNKSNIDKIKSIRFVGKSKQIATELIGSL